MGFFSPLLYMGTAQAFTPNHHRDVNILGIQDIWPGEMTRFNLENDVSVKTAYNSIIGGYVITDYDPDEQFDAEGWWFHYRVYHWEDTSVSTTLIQSGPYIFKVTHTIYGRIEASSSDYMEVTLIVWVDCEGDSGYTLTIHDYRLSDDINLLTYTSSY